MRVFLCAFAGFSLAIPMRSVSSMMLHEKKAKQLLEYDRETHLTYVSLPILFGLPLENTRHGLILKNSENEDIDTKENKTILLTTEVECETEIPDKKIYPLPKAFGAMQFSLLFSGIQFDPEPNRQRAVTDNSNTPADSLVLLLDIEQLIQRIQ